MLLQLLRKYNILRRIIFIAVNNFTNDCSHFSNYLSKCCLLIQKEHQNVIITRKHSYTILLWSEIVHVKIWTSQIMTPSKSFWICWGTKSIGSPFPISCLSTNNWVIDCCTLFCNIFNLVQCNIITCITHMCDSSCSGVLQL